MLAWLVRGAVRYGAKGLHAPATVNDATASYQVESDPLADFLAEAIEPEPESEIGAGELYDCYVRWAKEQGLQEREQLTNTAFGRRMSARFHWRRTGGRKVYLDLAQRSHERTE